MRLPRARIGKGQRCGYELRSGYRIRGCLGRIIFVFGSGTRPIFRWNLWGVYELWHKISWLWRFPWRIWCPVVSHSLSGYEWWGGGGQYSVIGGTGAIYFISIQREWWRFSPLPQSNLGVSREMMSQSVLWGSHFLEFLTLLIVEGFNGRGTSHIGVPRIS